MFGAGSGGYTEPVSRAITDFHVRIYELNHISDARMHVWPGSQPAVSEMGEPTAIQTATAMTGHLSATNEGDVSPPFHFSSSTYQNWSVQVGILRRHYAPNTLVWATKDRSFSRCNLLDKWKEQEVTSETPTSVHNRLGVCQKELICPACGGAICRERRPPFRESYLFSASSTKTTNRFLAGARSPS
jgi:hypothetical protein